VKGVMRRVGEQDCLLGLNDTLSVASVRLYNTGCLFYRVPEHDISPDNSGDGGFPCDQAAVFRDILKDTSNR
jgi:hypothetical protein